MTDLYLVRHAIAESRDEWAALGKADEDRPLSERGIKRFQRGARGLLMFTGNSFEVFTSPLKRADQTASIIQKASPGKVSKKHIEALGSGGEPQESIKQLGKLSGRTLVVVGHEPDLTEMLEVLLADTNAISWKQLKKGSAVKVSFPQRVAAGLGTLNWLLEPRALRELGDSFDSYRIAAN